MSEFVLSPAPVPNLNDWTLIDYSGIQQSPMSGAIRSISRGQRWQAHVQYHDLINDDRAFLAALMASVRGKSNRVWLEDGSAVQRGSFPAPELLSNNYLLQGAAGFSLNGTGTLTGYNRALSQKANGVALSGVYQSVNLTAGNAYALRACILDGNLSVPISAGVQLTDGAKPVTNIGFNRGMITVAALIATGGAANQYPLLLSAGSVAGSIMLCTYASLRRCALAINPALATFYTTLNVDALPVSTNGLLRAGDRVEINSEFKTVTFDLNSDASGVGLLMFEPALRKVVPDNCPIIIGEPMMRGILTNNAMQVTRPGLLSDYDFTLQEA